MLFRSSSELPNGLRALSPPDMIIHAAAHLFADGDLAGGLRNLWDIDRLLREFGGDADFWRKLAVRAKCHNLQRAVSRALRLSNALYGTPLDYETRHSGPVSASTPELERAQETKWMPEHVRHYGSLTLVDRLYRRRLLARDGWGRPTGKLTRFAFYIRSHWIRMPPLMLARHLWTKARR